MAHKKTYLELMKHPGPEKKWSGKYWLYDFGRLILVPCWNLWYRPVVLYENEAAKKKLKEGGLLIANHQSHRDPVHLGTCIFPYRRIRYIAIHNFFERPVTRQLFPALLVIPVNRDKIDMASLKEIVGSIRDRWLVAIYPEGHVNWDAELTPFRRGVAAFASSANCQVVPVYILMKKRLRERLICAVGEPVDFSKFGKESGQESGGGIPRKEREALFCAALLKKEEQMRDLCISCYESRYGRYRTEETE